MSRTHRAGIVGRAESLRRLDEVMSASAEGRRSAVFVSGAAGMGKTSLIREAIDASTTDPVVVG